MNENWFIEVPTFRLHNSIITENILIINIRHT